MNKVMGVLLSAILVADVVVAQEVLSRKSFSASGAYGATAYVPAGAGSPVVVSMSCNIATAATVSVIMPDRKANAQIANVGTTNLYIKTDVLGRVYGSVPTTSDYVVFPETGTSNMSYAAITHVATNGCETNAYIRLGINAIGNVVSNDPVYIAIGANVQSIALPAAANAAMQYMAAGFTDNPLVIVVPAGAGATVLSGLVEYQR